MNGWMDEWMDEVRREREEERRMQLCRKEQKKREEMGHTRRVFLCVPWFCKATTE